MLVMTTWFWASKSRQIMSRPQGSRTHTEKQLQENIRPKTFHCQNCIMIHITTRLQMPQFSLDIYIKCKILYNEDVLKVAKIDQNFAMLPPSLSSPYFCHDTNDDHKRNKDPKL
jgi:hypothetical protein